jgi:acetoin utilization deacetylase AcuC-like enzyme
VTTFFYTHPDCLTHETGPNHPESAARLEALLERLKDDEFGKLVQKQAPRATLDQILAVHSNDYVDRISDAIPKSGYEDFDPSGTVISSGALDAAYRAAGSVIAAVDDVMHRSAQNVFCGVRPPGHHTETARTSGFCFFNNIAIGVRYLQKRYNLERIAVIDFDVHHGNGTQEILERDENVFFASLHQAFIFPNTGKIGVSSNRNVVNVPVVPSLTGKQIAETFTARIIPLLSAFEPEFIFISAGFDAHRNDPIGGLKLDYDDFVSMTQDLMKTADQFSEGRIVSALEGGYDPRSLANAAAVHILELMKA